MQLALDLVTSSEAAAIVEEVGDLVDIVEVGTPIVINEGLGAVRRLRALFPELRILADLKIMDAGGYEVTKAAEAGADIITVLGASDDLTVLGAVEAARATKTQIMVDLMNVAHVDVRAKELESLDVDYICVHSGYDHQAAGRDALSDLHVVKQVARRPKIAIAGGITLSSLRRVVAAGPDLIVVGGGITRRSDKRATAREMRRLLHPVGASP